MLGTAGEGLSAWHCRSRTGDREVTGEAEESNRVGRWEPVLTNAPGIASPVRSQSLPMLRA